MRRTRIWFAAAIMISLIWNPAVGQDLEGGETSAQDGFPYVIDETVDPKLELAGVRFNRVRVAPKDMDKVRSGKEISSTVYLGFENTSELAAKVRVLIALEDADGNQLDVIESTEIKIGAGDVKEEKLKKRIEGDALLATQSIYIDFEIL